MAPAITITSEELRERVEDYLGRWIPDDLWDRSEPYARRKLDLCRERNPEIDYYNDEYLVLLTADTVRETALERAARCNRATPARKSDSQPAHGSRTQSITRRRRRAKARIRQAAVLLTAAVMVAGIGVAVSTIGTDRPTAADLPTPTAEQPAVVIQTPAASTQTPEPTKTPARYPLSVSERDTVERVVMAEAGGESFAGQMLVAQCILNAAEKEGVQPSEAVEIYSYTSNRPDPTQSVKDAVAAVFDRGEVAIDAPVMYFYNPALVTSTWHESQIFVAEVGGHRFFAERSPNE